MPNSKQSLSYTMERERDPYVLFRKVMEYTGVAKSDKLKNEKLYPFLSSYLLAMLVVQLCSCLFYALENHPFDDKIEGLQCLMSMFHLIGKVLNLKFCKTKFKRFIDDSMVLWREMGAYKGNENLLKDIRNGIDIRIKVIMGMFAATVPAYTTIWLIRNFTLEPEYRENLFKVWDPFKTILGVDYLYACSAYHAFIMAHALVIFATVYLCYFIPCFMAAAQMKVLAKMLSSKELNVIACVKLHQKSLKFVKDISELFSGQMFFETVLSSFPIALRCYQLIQMLSSYDPRAFGVLFFLVLCLEAPFVVCFSGQMIRDASEELFLGTYQNEWYHLNLKDSKSLCIMMTRTSMFLNLGYKNIMMFNMERYLLVVQATYSYITILINS